MTMSDEVREKDNLHGRKPVVTKNSDHRGTTTFTPTPRSPSGSHPRSVRNGCVIVVRT